MGEFEADLRAHMAAVLEVFDIARVRHFDGTLTEEDRAMLAELSDSASLLAGLLLPETADVAEAYVRLTRPDLFE